MVLRNVIRQLGTPDHLRGRMTGINMVFFQGGPQLGELEAGAVAQWIGAARIGRDRRRRLPHRNGVDCRANARAQKISPQLH